MSSEKKSFTGNVTFPVNDYIEMLNSMPFPACILSTAGKVEYTNTHLLDLYKDFSENSNAEDFDWKKLFEQKYKGIIANAFLKSLNGASTRINVQLSSLVSEDAAKIEMNMLPLERSGKIEAVLLILNSSDSLESLDADAGSAFETQHFEYSPLPMIRFGSDLRILKVSETFHGVFGSFRNDEKQLKWDDISGIFKYDAEKIRIYITEIFSGAQTHKRMGEIRVSLKDQVSGMVNITLYPIRFNGKILYVEMILEDITKVKALKGKLENFRRMNLINDIGKGFTHSINNTLNVVLNQTQFLQIIAIKDPVIKGLEQIEKYVHQTVEHIKRIQLFLGDYSHGHEERIEVFDTIVKDALEFVKIHFRVVDTKKRSNIEIECGFEQFEQLRIKTDTKLLRELIIWSMLRVSSYTEKNGKISVNLIEGASYALTFSCEKRKTDTSENIVPYTIDGFSTSEIRESAEKLNLKIIEHESSGNYSIEILFPDWMIFRKSGAAEPGNTTRVTGKKVMIVEDEEGLRTILSNLFKRMNNRVFVADNGRTALEELERNSYDVLISDYDISGITGIELIARARELDEKVITLLMSAWELGDMSLYENIVDFFVSKPFNIEDLLNIISTKIKS